MTKGDQRVAEVSYIAIVGPRFAELRELTPVRSSISPASEPFAYNPLGGGIVKGRLGDRTDSVLDIRERIRDRTIASYVVGEFWTEEK